MGTVVLPLILRHLLLFAGAAFEFQTEGVVERTTPGSDVTMVAVITRQADLAGAGFDVAAAVVITGLKRKRHFRVGKKRPIIAELGGDPPAVAKQRVAQAKLDPIRTFAGTLGNHKRLGIRDEAYCFAEFFVTGLRVEFFLDLPNP